MGMALMPWRLRFRLDYLKKYGWFERFAFGFLIGPLLFYKTGQTVYVKKWISQNAIDLVTFDLIRLAYDEAKEEFFRSIPYDFGFLYFETFNDFDIDRDQHRIIIEGTPSILKPAKD